MEASTQPEIDLFGSELPSMEELEALSRRVRSSEANMLVFGESLDAKMSKTSPRTCLGVGIGLYILRRDEEAVKKLQKGKDCKEKFAYLAFALRRMRLFDEAIENLDKGLDFGDDRMATTFEKVATLRRSGRLDEAEEELKGCANFEHVSVEYHYQRGRLLEVRGFYTEAVEQYKAALELSPDHQKTLFRLAYRCDLAGDEEAAIEYYQQIGASSPAYVSALLNAAVLFEDAEKYDRASRCVDLVLESHPNHQRAIMFKKDIESSKTMFYDEEKEKKKTRKNQILETPISDFELSVRSRNCLKKMKIETIGDLLNITEAELLSYKNFGETSLKEIKVILDSKSLRLGMALEEKQFGVGEGADVEGEGEDEGFMNKTVEDLQLSVRARKCLEKLDIHTIGELTRRTDAELLGCKNFGVTSLNEIKKALSNLGLSLRSLD